MTQPDDPFNFAGDGRRSAEVVYDNTVVGGLGPDTTRGPVGGSDPWGFGGDRQSSFAQAESAAGPPFVWLAATVATAIVGLILAVALGTQPVAAIVAWVLCGPIAIGLLAVFTSVDTRNRAKPIYSQPEWVGFAYWGGFALSLVGVAFAAWRIADWVGHL